MQLPAPMTLELRIAASCSHAHRNGSPGIEPHFNQVAPQARRETKHRKARKLPATNEESFQPGQPPRPPCIANTLSVTVVLGSVIMKKMKSWYIGPVSGAISDCQGLPVI